MNRVKKSTKVWANRCQNYTEKKCPNSGLRTISKKLHLMYPDLPVKSKLCWKCRVDYQAGNRVSGTVFKDTPTEGANEMDLSQHSDDMSEDKNSLDGSSVCSNMQHKDAVEVLQQLKEHFNRAVTYNEKLMLLTLVPKSWGRVKIASVFGATKKQSSRAKQLISEDRILTLPSKKPSRKISEEVAKQVISFYERDDISRLMPGMKDYLSVKLEDGSREHVQKRLLLGNIDEIFKQFQYENANVNISFTSFTKLRPKNCVSAGSSGTHNVCVCLQHENMKLLIDAVDFKSLTKHRQTQVKDLQDLTSLSLCSNPKVECHMGECISCPKVKVVKEYISTLFDENCIIEVRYDRWNQTDRCKLETLITDADEYINAVCERLPKFNKHNIIAKEQSAFVRQLKGNLKSDEVVLSMDFAENYAFLLQDSVQSFHWNNDQATVFTSVAYYLEDGELKHKSFGIISDNLNHDTIAVCNYQKILIGCLKKIKSNMKKNYYITDGAAQHFKNKSNFANLTYHKTDYNIEGEWHFQATAHGKGACDGIGANLKRQAARYSLQCPSDGRITDARAFYNWAKNNCKETTVLFSSKEEHLLSEKMFKPRFEQVTTIRGTLQYHSFIPLDNGSLKVKNFSNSSNYTLISKSKLFAKQKI